MTVTITPSAIGLLLLIVAVYVVISWLGLDTDDSDQDGRHRSGVAVVTDHKTGLQYLRTALGGITPRLDVDGRQMREGR